MKCGVCLWGVVGNGRCYKGGGKCSLVPKEVFARADVSARGVQLSYLTVTGARLSVMTVVFQKLLLLCCH